MPSLTPAHSFASAKEVEDFHRNSDKDKRPESQHHTIGRTRYQASPGDHIHDGGSSQPLWTDIVFTGNLGLDADLITIVQKIIQALEEKGATGTPTVSGVRYEIATGTVTLPWSGTNVLSDAVAITFPIGRFSAAPIVTMTRQTTSTVTLEGRISTGATTAGFSAQACADTALTSGNSASYKWIAVNVVAF